MNVWYSELWDYHLQIIIIFLIHHIGRVVFFPWAVPKLNLIITWSPHCNWNTSNAVVDPDFLNREPNIFQPNPKNKLKAWHVKTYSSKSFEWTAVFNICLNKSYMYIFCKVYIISYIAFLFVYCLLLRVGYQLQLNSQYFLDGCWEYKKKVDLLYLSDKTTRYFIAFSGCSREIKKPRHFHWRRL
jgi:hypothetical protein